MNHPLTELSSPAAGSAGRAYRGESGGNRDRGTSYLQLSFCYQFPESEEPFLRFYEEKGVGLFTARFGGG